MRMRRDERGTTLVEMAFLLPLLVLMVLGVADLGRLLFTQVTLNEAVQEGSLYLVLNPSDPVGGRQRVVGSVDDPALDINNVIVDCPGGVIRVRVTHDMDLITPVLGGGSVTLDAEVSADPLTTTPCATSP